VRNRAACNLFVVRERATPINLGFAGCPGTDVNIGAFPAFLQGRREVRTATSTSGGPHGGRGSDLAIFPGIGTHLSLPKTPSAGVTAQANQNMIAIDDRNWPPLRPHAARLLQVATAARGVLRHQLNVLQQRASHRLHLRWADRALLIWLYRRCPRILDAITIVRPRDAPLLLISSVLVCAPGAQGRGGGDACRNRCSGQRMRSGRFMAFPE
jgi:hypothetical protein